MFFQTCSNLDTFGSLKAIFWRSFSLLNSNDQVWLEEYPMMRFREETQHSVCSTCIRHRSLIRGLGGHIAARRKQIELFHAHLGHQYMDRVLYWEQRGLSRLRGSTVCVIADGMDQHKFSLPRAACLGGKDFSAFQRVKLHIACAICHGRFILFTISGSDTKKDANCSIELLAHVLTILERQGQHLPSTTLWLQHDNTCREFKNTHGLRWACAQVASKNLSAISCGYLRTGHTHEDVDATFGNLTKHMLKCRKLQTPNDVKLMIEDFLRNAKMPFEGERHVVLMDNVRDWTLALEQGINYLVLT